MPIPRYAPARFAEAPVRLLPRRITMSSILHPFTLVTKAVRAFFVSDLHVRRGDHGLEVVLDDPDPEGDAAKGKARSKGKSKAAPATEKDLLELRRMQESLARLLDELPENRKTLRHLVFVEQALGKKGLRALHKLPFDVLKRALDQFEGLVVNWSDEGLAALRSKMAVAVIEREPDPSTRVPGPPVESANSVMDTAPLAHPVSLEGEEAVEAEAALRAAYGSVVMPGREVAGADDAPALVEMQGELNSPSGQALAKAVRRGDEVKPATTRQRESSA